MPVVTEYPDGSTTTEYSAEELQETMRIIGEVAARMGYDHETEEKDTRVSIQNVVHVVAWAFAYAPADHPLDESHPLWSEFFTRSE